MRRRSRSGSGEHLPHRTGLQTPLRSFVPLQIPFVISIHHTGRGLTCATDRILPQHGLFSLRHRLRPNATRAEQALAHVLQQRMRLPDYALILLFSIRPATISAIVLWFALAPLAARYSLGPLYVLCTILAVILTNLGTRKEGEMSAYSIFNTGARQLPGEDLLHITPSRHVANRLLSVCTRKASSDPAPCNCKLGKTS